MLTVVVVVVPVVAGPVVAIVMVAGIVAVLSGVVALLAGVVGLLAGDVALLAGVVVSLAGVGAIVGGTFVLLDDSVPWVTAEPRVAANTASTSSVVLYILSIVSGYGLDERRTSRWPPGTT